MAAKILITGGMGFIGSHLSAELLRRGHSVTTITRSSNVAYPEAFGKDEEQSLQRVIGDVRDQALLAKLVAGSDVIFHKAAAVGVAASAQHVHDFVNTNIAGTANLVDVLRAGRHQVNKIILGSSISVYGEGNYCCGECGIVRPDLRLSQKQIEELNDWNPRCPNCLGHIEPDWTPESASRNGESVYAITKKSQEDLLVSTCRLLGITIVVLRYCTVYGPGQSAGNPYSQFTQMLINGQSPMITEDGLQGRDFIYISDVVSVNVDVLETNLAGINFFNVGSGIQTPLLDFVVQVRERLAAVGHPETAQPHCTGQLVPGEIRYCQADCSAVKKRLKFEHKISFKDGAASLTDWFISKQVAGANSMSLARPSISRQ